MNFLTFISDAAGDSLMLIVFLWGIIIVVAYIVLTMVLGKKIEAETKPETTSEIDADNLTEMIDEYHAAQVAKRKFVDLTAENAESPFELIAKRVIPMKDEKREKQEEKMHRAGIKMSPEAFMLKNILFGVAAALMLFIVLSVADLFDDGNSYLVLLLSFMGGVGVYVVMDQSIANSIQKRTEAIERQMPSTLQLLSIITMSGSGLEQAFKYIAEHQNNEMAEEIRLCYQEMHYGASSQQALTNMAERNSSEPLKMFCGAMIQGINQGMSVSDILLQQSEAMETRQRLYLEEQANKIPTKMIVPIMFCAMPSMFIVILAPAFSQLMAAFE